MKCGVRFLKSFSFLSLFLLLLPALTFAQRYTQKNLVSDVPQPDNADKTKVLVDANLKNPWGLTRSPGGSPWWVANNNSGTSTLYDGNGNPRSLVVTVPPPGFAPGTQSAPTGVVFNGSPTDFLLARASKPSSFLPRKTALSLAGIRALTLRPASPMPSSKWTIPIMVRQTVQSTKAQPPPK